MTLDGPLRAPSLCPGPVDGRGIGWWDTRTAEVMTDIVSEWTKTALHRVPAGIRWGRRCARDARTPARLPADLVTAIGRVAVNGATLSMEILAFQGSILQHTAYVEPTRLEGEKAKKVRAAPDDFSRAVDLLKKALRLRMSGKPFSDVMSYLHDAKVLMRQRNLIVHGMWSARLDADGRHECAQWKTGGGDGADAPRFSVADVNEIAEKLRSLSGDMHEFIFRVVEAIPEMQKSVESLSSMDELRERHAAPDAYGIA